MTVGQRFLLTLAIVIATLLALAALGYFTGNWDEDESARPGYGLASAAESQIEIEPCMDEATRERIRALMIDAIDDALHDHIKNLFSIWMKDERGQPARAAVGVRQAIRAYLGSRSAAMKWDPPKCAN